MYGIRMASPCLGLLGSGSGNGFTLALAHKVWQLAKKTEIKFPQVTTHKLQFFEHRMHRLTEHETECGINPAQPVQPEPS